MAKRWPPSLASLSREPYHVVQSVVMTVSPGEAQTASAECPEGTRPLMGGEANTSLDGTVLLERSNPDGQSWLIGVRNASDQDQQFVGLVVCGNVKGYKVSHGDNIIIAAGETRGDARSERTRCRSKSPLVVGGGLTVQISDTADAESAIDHGLWPAGGNAWGAEVTNGDPVDVIMLVHAVCARAVPGYEIVSQKVALAPDEYSTAQIACPEGKFAISGGVHMVRDNGVLTDSYPLDATKWEVFVKNRTAEPDNYKLYAVCGR